MDVDVAEAASGSPTSGDPGRTALVAPADSVGAMTQPMTAKAVPSPGGDDPVDGRRLRRDQNRRAALQALVELFAEGTYAPSMAEVAERAGLSPRSLFRYFDDVDDLRQAAIEHHLELAAPLVRLDVGPEAPTADKVARLVASRMALYETVRPAAHVVRINADRHAAFAEQLHSSRRFLRRQVQRLFAPELSGPRAALAPAVDVLCSFETYELLRVERGLSKPKTAAAVSTALLALLDDGR